MKNPEKSEWWRLNKLLKSTETIEWTHCEGGHVRAKLDSMANWEYRKCGNAFNALSYGEKIVSKQKRERGG